MNYELDAFLTIVISVIVLLIGHFFVKNITILKKYNIPEPVVGGLVAAVVTYILFVGLNITVSFDAKIQQIFMLMFFTSVGLSASLLKLKEGGKALILFLVCVIIFVFLQNIVGISLAKALGLDPLIGLIVGSVTLTGCQGYTASGKYVGNGDIYQYDDEYGMVYIVAGGSEYPFGTIVRFKNVNYFGKDIYAIVLDRGGAIGKKLKKNI